MPAPTFFTTTSTTGRRRGRVAWRRRSQREGQEWVDGGRLGDFDHDGLLDITVTNFADRLTTFTTTKGQPKGRRDGWSSKTGAPVYPYVKWGTGFVDLDTMGGPTYLWRAATFSRKWTRLPSTARDNRQPMFLFRNKGDRTLKRRHYSAAGLAATSTCV